MALSDKDILITPNRGQSADPRIEFKGADASSGPNTISLNVYPTNNGTVSFEGSAGQLFSVTNSLTGTIFSASDVSGVPSIEVLDSGLIKLGQYSGNVLIGKSTDSASYYKLQVKGNIQVSDTSPYIRWSEGEVDKAFIQWSSSGAHLLIGNDVDVSRIKLQDDIQFTMDGGLNWYKMWHGGNDGASSGLDADLLDGNHASAFSLSGHNHTYDVNNEWLRDNGDDGQFKIFGNSRTLIFRTDGNTNAHGGGAYADIFFYGGSDDSNRIVIFDTDGDIWNKATNSWYADWHDQGVKTTSNPTFNSLKIASASPTIYLKDSDHRSAMIHTNSNTFYILRGDAVNSETWGQFDSAWPLTINLENNTANFGGQITKRGINVPALHIQDAAPTPYNDGDLWWESDTGKLKIRYNDGSTTQWVDALPIPDISTLYSKAGGAITGAVSVSSSISATGNISSDARVSGVHGYFAGGTTNAATDATVYITAADSSDWGLIIDKPTLDYGVKVNVGSGATYGISIVGGGSEVFRVNGAGAASIVGGATIGSSASLSFGSTTRQMINTYGTSYGIGVQSSTLYFRTDGRFSWFRGGSHNDGENNAGGGSAAMTLDSASKLTVYGNMRTDGGIIYLNGAETTYMQRNSTTGCIEFYC